MLHHTRSESLSSGVPPDLEQLIKDTGSQDEAERIWRQMHGGESAPAVAVGNQYLLFTCGGVRCAVALRTLREVLSQTPTIVLLPHSPPWTLGMFALRAELIALVDPAPVLLGRALDEASAPTSTVLLVGNGARTLGWAVGEVGAIAVIPPEDIAPASSADPVWDRYALGVYAPANNDGAYVLLDADRLLDDLLTELEEREQSHG